MNFAPVNVAIIINILLEPVCNSFKSDQFAAYALLAQNRSRVIFPNLNLHLNISLVLSSGHQELLVD